MPVTRRHTLRRTIHWQAKLFPFPLFFVSLPVYFYLGFKNDSVYDLPQPTQAFGDGQFLV